MKTEKSEPKVTEKKEPRGWHMLFGEMLTYLLVPVKIEVLLETSVMASPPKMDLLLLRKGDQACWNEQQKARLPDEIRDTTAKHIVIEFKYTESFNEASLSQAFVYDYLYKTTRGLSHKEVRTFLVCSRTTQSAVLKGFGYQQADFPGVFKTDNKMAKHITLISLNDLADNPHNAGFKLFSSKVKEKRGHLAP